MNSAYYPDIEASALLHCRSIFDQMADDPLWLERPGCHYDDDLKDKIRALWGRGKVVSAVAQVVEPAPVILGGEGKNPWDGVGEELTSLYNELRNFKGVVGEDGEVIPIEAKDQMAFFRTATSLLDKIVGLSERANNVKSVSEFTSRVIAVFDEVLTPQQRTQAMSKLGVEL